MGREESDGLRIPPRRTPQNLQVLLVGMSSVVAHSRGRHRRRLVDEHVECAQRSPIRAFLTNRKRVADQRHAPRDAVDDVLAIVDAAVLKEFESPRPSDFDPIGVHRLVRGKVRIAVRVLVVDQPDWQIGPHISELQLENLLHTLDGNSIPIPVVKLQVQLQLNPVDRVVEVQGRQMSTVSSLGNRKLLLLLKAATPRGAVRRTDRGLPIGARLTPAALRRHVRPDVDRQSVQRNVVRRAFEHREDEDGDVERVHHPVAQRVSRAVHAKRRRIARIQVARKHAVVQIRRDRAPQRILVRRDGGRASQISTLMEMIAIQRRTRNSLVVVILDVFFVHLLGKAKLGN